MYWKEAFDRKQKRMHKYLLQISIIETKRKNEKYQKQHQQEGTKKSVAHQPDQTTGRKAQSTGTTVRVRVPIFCINLCVELKPLIGAQYPKRNKIQLDLHVEIGQPVQ